MMKPKFLTQSLMTGFAVAIATMVSSTAALAADAAPPVVQTNSPWVGMASIGLTLTRGNSENVLFTANAKMARKGPLNEIAFGADGAYGETTTTKRDPTATPPYKKVDTTTKSAAMAHAFAQYNRIFNEQLYGYARLDALHDDIADISYRLSFSPGVGHYFIKNTNTTLAVEVGPGVVNERTGSGQDAETSTYATLRIAERFEHKFNASVRLWQTLEYLPQVDRWGNYLVNFEVGVEAAMTKSLSLLTYFQDNYDNEPSKGRKCNDMKLVAAVGVKF